MVLNTSRIQDYFFVANALSQKFLRVILLADDLLQDVLYAEIPEYNIPISIRNRNTPIQGNFFLIDQTGNKLITQRFNGRFHSVNVAKMSAGLYIIKMRSEGIDLTEKIVIIR